MYLLVLVIISAALTGAYLFIARRYQLLDKPNERSSHTIPTPRGGGIAFVVMFLVFTLLISFHGHNRLFGALFVGGLGVSLVGLLDDYTHVTPRIRFVVHIVVAVLAAMFLIGVPGINIFGLYIPFSILTVVINAITIIWFINLFNFMDGIDGFAACEIISVAVLMAFFTRMTNLHLMTHLLLGFAACVAGFLVWNKPKAKIFMGDVGSGFLGFIIISLLLYSVHKELTLFWPWVIMLSVFWMDATVTLVRRVRRGKKFYVAHCSHAYQHLAKKYKSHAAVTYGGVAINVIWLFPWAWLALSYPTLGFLFALCAVVPLFILCLRFNSGIDA